MCVIFDCGHHHLESCLSTSPLTCDLAGLFKSKHGGFFACLFVCLFCFVSVFAGAIVCDHLSHAVILSCIKKCLYCCYYYCDFFSQWVGSDRDRTVERYPRKYYTPEIFYWLFLKLKKLFCCLKGLTIEQQVWKSALHVGHCSMKLWKWIFFSFFFFLAFFYVYCIVGFVFCFSWRKFFVWIKGQYAQFAQIQSRKFWRLTVDCILSVFLLPSSRMKTSSSLTTYDILL